LAVMCCDGSSRSGVVDGPPPTPACVVSTRSSSPTARPIRLALRSFVFLVPLRLLLYTVTHRAAPHVCSFPPNQNKNDPRPSRPQPTPIRTVRACRRAGMRAAAEADECTRLHCSSVSKPQFSPLLHPFVRSPSHRSFRLLLFSRFIECVYI